MFLLVAEGAGHTATAGKNKGHLVTGGQLEHLHGRRNGRQRLLVAVAVEPDGLRARLERGVADAVGVGLAEDELVDEERVLREGVHRVEQVVWHEVFGSATATGNS